MFSIQAKIIEAFEEQISKNISENNLNTYSLSDIYSIKNKYKHVINNFKKIINNVFSDYLLSKPLVIEFDSLRLSISVTIQVGREELSKFLYTKSIRIDMSLICNLYFICGLDDIEVSNGKKLGALYFAPLLFPYRYYPYDNLLNAFDVEFAKRFEKYQKVDYVIARERLPDMPKFVVNNELLPLSLYQLVFSDLDIGSLKCLMSY